MKRILFVMLLGLVIINPVFSEVVAIEGIVKPDMMIVKNNKLYILERTTIFIYSLKDFRLISKFGREGEGPKEFMARPFGPPMSMSFVSDQLVVNSNGKLSYFKGEGTFIKERKAFANLVLYQIKDNFTAIGPSLDEKNLFRISFRLYSNDLKEMKNLFHTNISVNPRDNIILPHSAFTYNPSYKDKIVIAASNTDFIIDIFDHKGAKISQIKKDYQKQKISEKFIKDTMSWFKNESMFKQFFSTIKEYIKFKEYFPAMRDIHLADDTIHVVTYKIENDLWECILLDMKGNETNRLFIPLNRYIPFTYYAILYSIENKTIYSLIEDEDEEVWNLHIVKIN